MTKEKIRRRRGVAALATVAAAGLLLAGCSSSSSGGSNDAAGSSGGSCEPSTGKVTLQYWNWVPGMDKVLDVWNKSHPNIQVQMKNIANQSEQQITNAVKAGQAPDLAQIGFDSLPQFRSQDMLADVSACAPATEAKSKFIDWTWSQATFGGQGVFAFPQDIGPLALYYRADLFKKYGIPVPKTWADYQAAGKTLKAKDPKLSLTAFDPSNPWLFNGLMWQKGTPMYGYQNDKWVVSIDNPNARQVATYWQGLIKDGTVRTDLKNGSTPTLNAYSKGQLATMITAAWGYTTLRDNVPNQSGDWRVAPLPQWTAGENKAGDWGGSTVAFMKGGQHPYEAAQFNEWLNTDPEALKMLNELGGLDPAAKAGADLAAFHAGTKYYGGQNIFDVFNDAAKNIDTSWQWGPTQVVANTALGDAMTKAVANGSDLSAALKTSQDAVVAAMKAQAIPVTTTP
jgi:multiple sugar transport system substrate-binding protein